MKNNIKREIEIIDKICLENPVQNVSNRWRLIKNGKGNHIEDRKTIPTYHLTQFSLL